ncbi:MAG: sulfite exporter TauE/SafE family protein [Pseudomonadota bacterium]
MLAALDLTTFQVAALMAAYLIGGVVKGGMGFGLPLVTLAITPLFVPVDLAIVANSVILPFINGVQIRQAGQADIIFRRFLPLILPLCLVMPLGVWLGTQLPAERLTLALGLAVMAFTAFQVATPRLTIPPRMERSAGIVTGGLAGLTGGILTINGPLFVLFLVGVGAERRVMMGALGIFFVLTGLLLSISFAGAGLLDLPRALLGLCCLVPTFGGMWLGNRLAGRLPQRMFRMVVLAGLFVLGANIALRGLAL